MRKKQRTFIQTITVRVAISIAMVSSMTIMFSPIAVAQAPAQNPNEQVNATLSGNATAIAKKSAPPGSTTSTTAATAPGSANKHHFFKVKVAVQDKLEELPSSLRVGSVFEESNLPQYSADEKNFWYIVPDWMAGVYAYGPARKLYLRDYIKKTENKDPDEVEPALAWGRYRGVFKDTKGQIWQKLYGGTVDLPPESEVSKVKTVRFEDALVGAFTDPNTYVESSTGSEFFISKETGKILRAIRYERVRRFVHTPGGGTEATYSDKMFDENGSPMNVAITQAPMVKKEDFKDMRSTEPNNNEETYPELAKAFRQFMDFNETPELVPSDLAK